MSFDIQQNLNTGDLVFNSIRDLAGVEGESLIRQRIHTRLKIEKGAYLFDRSGTLGSRLSSMLGSGIPRNAESLRMLITEALEGMTDINIISIDVFTYNDGSGIVTDPRVIASRITYDLAFGNIGLDISSDNTQSSTLISIPV